MEIATYFKTSVYQHEYRNKQLLNYEPDHYIKSEADGIEKTAASSRMMDERQLMDLFEKQSGQGRETAGLHLKTSRTEASAGMNRTLKAPYSYLADENGMIEYNGVVFVCDERNNSINFGDVSNRENTVSIPLAQGGVLIAERGKLGDLAQAIGMFSPQDVNRILRAMAEDAQVEKKLYELEEDIKNAPSDEKKAPAPEDAGAVRQRESTGKFAEQSAKESDGEVESEIITRADGSRILMVTTTIGNMTTTVSTEISKPSELLNEAAEELPRQQGAADSASDGAENVTA